MDDLIKSLGLEPMEYDFIKLIHPIFCGMTREQACQTLGWSVPTGIRVWKNLVGRYPELTESIKKWTNPNEITRRHLKYPKKFSQLDDPYLGEDKIVRKF